MAFIDYKISKIEDDGRVKAVSIVGYSGHYETITRASNLPPHDPITETVYKRDSILFRKKFQFDSGIHFGTIKAMLNQRLETLKETRTIIPEQRYELT